MTDETDKRSQGDVWNGMRGKTKDAVREYLAHVKSGLPITLAEVGVKHGVSGHTISLAITRLKEAGARIPNLKAKPKPRKKAVIQVLPGRRPYITVVHKDGAVTGIGYLSAENLAKARSYIHNMK